MNKNITQIISILQFNMTRKNQKCFFFKNKVIINFLKVLWAQNLIWGYKLYNGICKVYLRYRQTKSVIYSIGFYNINIKVHDLKWLVKKNPQSIFILKTIKGYKSSFYCLKYNIGGRFIAQIN